MSLAERGDIFGASDESNAPFTRWSSSLESNQGGGKSQSNYDDGDAVMHHNQDDCAGRGVANSIDTTQEARDRDVLLFASDKRVWLPPQKVLDRLSDTIRGRYRIGFSIHQGFMVLNLARVTFAVSMSSTSTYSSNIDGTAGTIDVMVPRCSRHGTHLFATSGILGAMPGLTS